MRLPFTGKYPITQEFANKDIFDGKNLIKNYYSKYGLNGHNGIDYALPEGTKVIAPFDGKVMETGFDPGGYGNYIKIENNKEGCVLAHLKSVDVQLAFVVAEGNTLGKSGNTGASTGAHLHWGYYRIPRDRSNGYNGFIDQTPFLLNQTPTYIAKLTKAQIGFEIKPAIEIPVGKEPGKESFNYGKISSHSPAKLLDIEVFDNVYYYNIDQRYLGGGTGWSLAETVDNAPLYTEEKEPDVTPAEPNQLTYEIVLKDFNINSPEALHDILNKVMNPNVSVNAKDIKVDVNNKELTVPVKFNVDWLISLLSLDKLFKGGDK